MAHPKRKISKTRGRKRRSHNALTPTQLVSCTHCGESKKPHTVCSFCGYYKDREIIKVEVV